MLITSSVYLALGYTSVLTSTLPTSPGWASSSGSEDDMLGGIHSFVHLTSEWTLTPRAPGTILSTRDTSVGQTDTGPFLLGHVFQQRRQTTLYRRAWLVCRSHSIVEDSAARGKNIKGGPVSLTEGRAKSWGDREGVQEIRAGKGSPGRGRPRAKASSVQGSTRKLLWPAGGPSRACWRWTLSLSETGGWSPKRSE